MRLPLLCAALLMTAAAITPLSAQAAPTTKTVARAPVVAVLPFKVLNSEASLAHYGEGASEAVITKFINDRAVKVVEESQLDKAINAIARNQTGLFEEDSALAIGQMVDARYIVIGSVQLVGVDATGSIANAQLKVSARVLEVETRTLLVSESAFGPAAAAFTQYDEIGARLVSKVTNHLALRSTGATADNVAVDSLIAEGKVFDPAFPMQGQQKDINKAIAVYNKAMLRDPRSARAFLALGHAELRYSDDLASADPTRARKLLTAARDHLRASSNFDSGNPFTLTQLGRAEGKLGQHAEARDAFERALAIDSTFIAARFGLATALYASGQLVAAREQAVLAQTGGDTRATSLIGQIDQRIAVQKQKPTAAAQR